MTGNKLEAASKEDLKSELLRIKEKQKRVKLKEQEQSANTVETAITLVSGIGLSHLQGTKEKEVRKEHPDFDGLSPEEQKKLLAEKQGVMGIDLDLLVGVVTLGLSFTDMAGDSAGAIRAVGTGALTAYGARMAYDRAASQVEEEGA